MPRVGTLLGTGGRPEAQVQIIRKGKKATRIKRFANYGRSWVDEAKQVDTDLILDDGGRIWEQHSSNPGHATYLGLSGEPVGRLSVQRVYKHVIKARLYRGDQQWSEVQHFHPRDVRFDGGPAPAGTHPPGRTPSIMTARPSVTTSPGMTTSTKTRLPRSWPRTSEKIVLPIGNRASRMSGSRPRSRTSPGSAR